MSCFLALTGFIRVTLKHHFSLRKGLWLGQINPYNGALEARLQSSNKELMLVCPPHGLCHQPQYHNTPSLGQLDQSQVTLNDYDILLHVKVDMSNSVTYLLSNSFSLGRRTVVHDFDWDLEYSFHNMVQINPLYGHAFVTEGRSITFSFVFESG